jgi:carbamoyl-phosphate synthase/aspartate carbamoyltransferase
VGALENVGAVDAEGRLTTEDVTTRLYDNPKKIFELHDQVDSSLDPW